MIAAPVPVRTKLAYGLGAIAYGIKDNGFSTFLLLFYNQVVGLPAGVVSTVIALALVFDAMIDPVIGSLSDRTHTKWGRRHPWLYASALPIALTWMMLWFPPATSQAGILGWLLVAAVLTRAAIATNEVPSLAMAPEMTVDYHERTLVLRYRYLFGWAGGLAMLFLAYGVFLAPPLGALTGAEGLRGFQLYGIFGALVMAATVLISAAGTHRRMAHPPSHRVEMHTLGETLRAARETLSNRAFLILMGAGILSYTNQGIGFAISNYNLNFVWQFSSLELLIYAAALFLGVVVTFVSVSPIGRALGKKHAMALLTLCHALFVCSTYTLRLLDLFPEPGSPLLLPTFLTINTLGVAFGVGAMILGASMMSDVVEDSQERTGRREEGLFFAGALFMQKCASGLGILMTGWILSLAEFPAKAIKGSVPAEVLDRYTLMFVVVTMTIACLSALVSLRFPFGQAEHEARLAKLAVASAESGGNS
jgi:GPH family glycoside/pentoside/hexuronide:cation symporter